MFKCLSPLLFLSVAAAAQGQPPPAPLYDPQGRLIPYDVSASEASEAPRALSTPQATEKKRRPKATAKKRRSKAAAVTDGAGKVRKGGKKGSSKGAKPSAKKKRAR